MKAAYIKKYGDPSVIQYGSIEKPAIKPEQILVEVHCSSVNPIDWKIRSGKFKLLPVIKFPLVLGFDIAGTVVETGASVRNFKVGDEVMGMLPPWGGAYAEFAAVDEKYVALKPRVMTFEETAGIPLAALTAYQALIKIGELQKSQNVLIIGASGGVGSYAVQIAKTVGAYVYAVCGTTNVGYMRGLGADETIDYSKEDLHKLKDLDIIFDVAGHETFAKCEAMLKPEGIFISTEPHWHTIPSAAASFLRNMFVKGKRASVFNCSPDGHSLKKIGELADSGKLRTLVDGEYHLSKVAEAHIRSETRRARGKIIIKVKESE